MADKLGDGISFNTPLNASKKSVDFVPLKDGEKTLDVFMSSTSLSNKMALSEKSRKTALRCDVWRRDPVRLEAIQACAKAGNEAETDPIFKWGESLVSDAVSIACAGQILFGAYENFKVAQRDFVEGVLVEARKHPELEDAPGLQRIPTLHSDHTEACRAERVRLAREGTPVNCTDDCPDYKCPWAK